MTDFTATAPERATTVPHADNATPAAAPAPAAPEVSPTLIVLKLLPNGAKFNGNRITRAQEAGFDWLKGDRAIGLRCPDTGEEVARHVAHGGQEAVGQLKEIKVLVDPERCPLWIGAGTKLIESLERYAILINASICDAAGRALSEGERNELAERIDATMRARWKALKAARMVTLASGERRELSDLSFVHTVRREAGSKKRSWRYVCFDAEPMPCHKGRAQGYRMAREIIEFHRTHKTLELPVKQVIQAAGLASIDHPHGDLDKDSIANVASGFLAAIETLVRVGSRHLNMAWLEQRIEYEEAAHVEYVAVLEKQKREMVERLRKGREAAKARRAKEARNA
ncbi:hypothetical protein [Ottowia testudinis]|uniref:Uncharacterized protein n=1 Tax=Ottowia testudinis TaxID=2816950 RepID=A0A975H549_9BURK|nr:hypothetical protein [Ottowia testudinis]QTD44582.1 hypothetical protein J1M35_16010 [Ottowia testudinis]